MEKELFDKISSPFIQLINSLVSPAIITVIVTALAGPYVVQSILERIETKKRQAEVINQVLNIFDKADFSNDLTVGKLELISTMVGENKQVYNLEFSNTLTKLKEENLKIIGKIKSQLTDKDNLIKKEQDDINSKTSNITALNSEITELKRKLKQNNSNEDTRLQLQGELKTKENNLNQFQRELNDLHNSLDNEKNVKQALQTSLDLTKEDLDKISEEKKLLEKRLENETGFLSNQLALAKVEIKKQSNEITQLQHENDILKTSKPDNTPPTQENRTPQPQSPGEDIPITGPE